jgi:hypothetical protein
MYRQLKQGACAAADAGRLSEALAFDPTTSRPDHEAA